MAAFLLQTPRFKSCISATRPTTLDNVMLLACNSSTPPKPAQAIVATWFEWRGCWREIRMGEQVQTSFPQKNQTCVSWLSDILCVECMLVYALSVIIICETIRIDFYLFFHSMLYVTIFTDTAPASPLHWQQAGCKYYLHYIVTCSLPVNESEIVSLGYYSTVWDLHFTLLFSFQKKIVKERGG